MAAYVAASNNQKGRASTSDHLDFLNYLNDYPELEISNQAEFHKRFDLYLQTKRRVGLRGETAEDRSRPLNMFAAWTQEEKDALNGLLGGGELIQ
jgi:hypothetical protein